MSSPRERAAELARFYTVTEPQRHPRGYTVYKVTARIVSRRNPEDVQEIVVWKRYSDFKKLHKDLWQIHKNLFRHTELFPPFAKAIVFGANCTTTDVCFEKKYEYNLQHCQD